MHCGTYLDLVAGSQQATVDGTTLTGSFDCIADQQAGIGHSIGNGQDGTWFTFGGQWTTSTNPPNYTILAPVDA